MSDEGTKMAAPHYLDGAMMNAHQIERLRTVARYIFDTTFAHLYERAPFDEFLDASYGVGGAMDRDLRDPAIDWCVAAVRDDPIGYAKLTPLRAPVPDAAPGALELQQIYVVPDWHGKGVAQDLLDWGVGAARSRGACTLYLTVFDHNRRAKSFYTRNGFAEIGRCSFRLGDRVDDDRIWRKHL
jgi:GNAT superfamily N-acetyltransferase